MVCNNKSPNITVAAKSIEATGYYFYGNAVSLTATDGDIYSAGSGQYGIQASGDVTVATPNGAISVEGTGHAIKAMDYSINLAAKNDVTLNGTVYGKKISITSEAGKLTINGHYEAIEGTQTSVTLSAPSGDIILNANNSSSIISGSNNFTLAITAGGKGYVIFTPAEGETKATLLLHNATIHNQTTLTDNAIGVENEGIALPTGNIIIKVEGTNSITSSYGDGMGYLGSHVTLTGSGVLTIIK